jgi:septal ring factor EnvC (AmiA/AmiB activator)
MLHSSYSYTQRYRPASNENMAAAAHAAAHRHAEDMRRYNEHKEEIKYQKRQSARAAREAREAAAPRKAFEEERKRLDEPRRKTEEERRKNEEQVNVAAWARYERGWIDPLNGVTADGRQVRWLLRRQRAGAEIFGL